MRGVVRADHDDAAPGVRVRPRVLRGVVLLAPEDVHPREVRHVREPRDAHGDHELAGAERELGAVALDDHGPRPGLLVVARAARLGGPPVRELHHPRVHLQPVAELVLRREHRPVVGEREVRQVVVPDRVVQAERLVAPPPRVAGPGVALDDDRRHAELAQTGAERDPALAPADDQDLGLDLAAERGRLAAAGLEPGLAGGIRAVLHAPRPPAAQRLLVALELVQRGHQRPRPALPQSQVRIAAARAGLERQPGAHHAVVLRGRLGRPPAAGPRGGERVLEQVAHAVRALDRLDVPRERDEVAPQAVVAEELARRARIAARQRLAEARQPAVDLGGG